MQTDGSSSNNSFSPTLSKAIARQNRDTNSSAGKTANNSQRQPVKAVSRKGGKDPVQTVNPQGNTDAATLTPQGLPLSNNLQTTAPETTAQATQNGNSDTATLAAAAGTGLSAGASLANLQQTTATSLQSGPVPGGQQPSTAAIIQNPAVLPADDPLGKFQANSSLSDSLQTQPQNGQTASQSAVTAGQGALKTATTGPGADTLVGQQLQTILTAHGATVLSVSATNQGNSLNSLTPPLLATVSPKDPKALAPEVSTKPGGILVPQNKGVLPEKAPESQTTKLTGEFEASPGKADQAGPKDAAGTQSKDSGLQNANDGKNATLQDSMGTSDPGSQQTSQFNSFSSALTQNMPADAHSSTTTNGSSGTNYLPTWTPAQESSLMTQVMQNFSASSGSPASKLSIKLHPEELGELKIDIQMKDGAVKANIATQNEQVQQVLEKYIPKLKNFMEQQGLTVDDIHVANTSENVDGNSLFQQNFANNHDFSSPGKFSQSSTPLADLSFQAALSETAENSSGVNVTV
jgi:flagellar hook-length control protein FliK